MNIIYIHQHFTTRNGSSGTRSYEFSRYLVSEGHKVTIITGASDLSDIKTTKLYQRLNIEGINVIALNIFYSNYMSFIRRVKSFLFFATLSTFFGLFIKKPDIVFATSTPLTAGIPGFFISKFKKIPFAFEVRDLWPEAPIQLGILTNPISIKFASWLERTLYSKANRIIALSPGMKEYIIKTGVEKDKIIVIPNCSDLDLFSPIIKDYYFKKKFGLKNKFVVSYFGALGDANGLELVLETAKLLSRRGEGAITFILAGDGKRKPSLELFWRENNLDNVIFIDRIPRKEVPMLVSSSNLCLVIFKNIPILQTNSPNKLFDGLAGGKPILVNFGGWIKELLENHNAGVYVEPDNPKAMADKLVEMSKKTAWCHEMGKNSRKLAEEKFDRNRLARKLEKNFEEVINARKN